MADANDVVSKKSGFRSLFGIRSSNKESRRKLSKSSNDAGMGERFDPSKVAVGNAQRQDSASFTRKSVDSRIVEDDDDEVGGSGGGRLRTYDHFAGFETNGLREKAYSDDYRRKSEVQKQHHHHQYQYQHQQYPTPPYYSTGPGLRSASEPQVPGNWAERIPTSRTSASAKTTPAAKLTKANRRAPTQRSDDLLDKDTGERKDLTDMMHAFTYNEALDPVEEKADRTSLDYDPSKPDGTAILGSASPEVWLAVADFLSPLDVANLSSTCRTLYARLGRQPYKLLVNPANRLHRLNFLLAMDHKLPRHLFCFPCAQWHLRIQPGLETLKPHNVLNPLFECPNRTNVHLPPPRIRITDGRMLPFAFVQLARRSHAFGSQYGIRHQSLARRWKEQSSGWSHESTYHVTDRGHVLMRVKSQHYVQGGMTAAAKRMLLFSRSDYTPYFSVCSHWKSGVLTSIPKCALDHIPFSAEGDTYAVTQLRDRAMGRKAVGLVNLCQRCRPMRRCPKCPTEYLFELKVLEDKSVHAFEPERFKQALLATRWSDLGPARSPDDAEWAAIMGENEGYESLVEIGRRAVSGVFESAFTDAIPGQRILSMNPKGVKADETGGDWY